MRCSFAATLSTTSADSGSSGGSAGCVAGRGARRGSAAAGAGPMPDVGSSRRSTPLSRTRASTCRAVCACAIRASISASGTGGSAPKNRSSAARSRKYSAIAFIVSKGSSNPSSVQEKVP